MILDDRLATFVEWCAAFQLRIAAHVDAGLVIPPASIAFDAARSTPTGAIPSAVSEAIIVLLDSARHAIALQRRTKPELARLRAHLDEFAAELAATPGFRTFTAELEAQVAILPPDIELHPVSSRLDLARGKGAPVSVPLRAWLEHSLVQPVAAALVQLDEETKAAVETAIAELDRLDKVTDYYALAVQRHGPEMGERRRVGEFAAAGLERAEALLRTYHDARRRDSLRLQGSCLRQVSAAIEASLAPLRSHRANDLTKQLRQLEHRDRARRAPPRLTRRISSSIRGAWALARPWLHELRLDVNRTLTDRRIDAVEERWAEMLHGSPNETAPLPVGYVRLFAAVPFELADVYLAREDLERACRIAIDAWLAGDPRSIVVEGDRGSGKRTLLNQVLPGIRKRADVHWLRLSHSLCDEASVVEAVARELELDATLRTFAELALALRADARRPIIVVENSERLFQRTPAGVDRMRAFLELVARSAAQTLWVLLMAAPAAELLDAVLDLERRVTDRVRVGTLGGEQTRKLILARHELSGHEVEFERPHPRPLERIRRPLQTARALANPPEAYFAQLTALSHGNPRQALYYWRASLRSSGNGQRILVRSLPPPHRNLLEHVALSHRILLALLVQHGSLTAPQLAAITLDSGGTTEGDLHVLRARGLAVVRDEIHWTLGPVVAHPLTLELRAQNLI